jgi:hypothetical protein
MIAQSNSWREIQALDGARRAGAPAAKAPTATTAPLVVDRPAS